MNGRVYYNEFEPRTAAWLRQLIADGHLPAGDVDERSIEDVVPSDLRGYRQCHFFAGIGGWAYALALAGWPADRPVWTGSCPCQPFSQAGAGAGFADERHLWPAWFHLIAQCRPPVVFGEQVASAAGHGWIDLVQADMEGQGYAVGHHVLGAHSVDAPHLRQRLWFVAYAAGTAGGWQRHAGPGSRLPQASAQQVAWAGGCRSGMADADGRGCEAAHVSVRSARQDQTPTVERWDGPWSSIDWFPCADGLVRPIGSGIVPLAHGLPARVVRLRGYGNAIVPQVAAEFIAAAVEAWEPLT